jgi:hypothetical protein
MAGEAASSATATIATNNINFLNFYLLIVREVVLIGGGPLN